MGGTCVDLLVGGIMMDYEIYAMQLNYSAPVSESSGERSKMVLMMEVTPSLP